MKLKFKNLKYSFRCLSVLIKYHPWFLFAQIVSMICLVIKTLIPINVVSKIVEAFNGSMSEEQIYVIVLTDILVLIVVSIVNLIVDFLMSYINSHFTLAFSTVLFGKLESIDYEFHESPNFLDNYTRALDNGAEKIYVVALHQMTLIKTLIQSIAVFVIILQIHYFALIYALVIALVYAIVRRKIGEYNFQMMTERRPLIRKRMYIRRTYYVKDAIPDIKTTDVGSLLLDENKELIDGEIEVFKKYSFKITFVEAFCNFIMASIYPVILGLACYFSLQTKDVNVLATITVAATTLSNLIKSFTDTLTNIQIEALEAKVAFEVLDMDSVIENGKGEWLEEDFEKLEVNNAVFSYPDKVALDGINISVNKGEKIAIVGANGAGKTTLVKMLLRLYDVSSGCILFNGKNYKDINPKSLRKYVGAVFQNNEDYSVTIAENVLLRKMETEEDEKLVIDALKFGDLYDYVMTLPEGINTMVTREFRREGTIFSGGQKQKLAVARGYAQNYQLFILDEPSSALDPLAETRMYHNMLELGKNKTLIFISHRLSATANVDRIYLIENGKVVEAGSHNELMRIENGRYREMFTSQSEKYIED